MIRKPYSESSKKGVWLGLSLGLILLLACIQACNNNPNPAFAVHPCSNTGSFGTLAGLPLATLSSPCSVFASPYTLTQNVDLYQIEVSGVAGSIAVGLYADYGGYPGSLITTSNYVNGAGISQTQTIPIPQVGLSPGTYWLAIGNQGPVTLSATIGSQVSVYSSGPCTVSSGLPATLTGSPTPITGTVLSVRADYCY